MIALSLLQTTPASEGKGYATVFIFHRFGDKRYPSTSVDLKEFRREMEYLKRHGYRVVSLKELYGWISEKKPIPPKTVVITIDDGYRTTMRAFKILKEFHFPFTVFLYMEAVGRYPDFLTIGDLREMESSGLVDFENHLYSHPNLGRLRIELSSEEYLKVLKRERELSEKRFFEIFKRKPRFLAFPYGDYDRLSVEFFKKAGYLLLLTQDRGAYDGREILVPRMAVVGSQSSFKSFVRDLSIEPLPVYKHYPDYGLFMGKSFKPIFFVKDLEKYENCWIYGTENGWFKGIKKEGKVISKKEIFLKRDKTRVGIKCFNRETKRWAEFFFLVLRGQSPQSH